MNIRKIGFIGGGNMATSLISGLIASGFASQQIWVSDTNQLVLQGHAENLHVNISASNLSVAEVVDVLVLAVKPQILRDIALELAPVIQQNQLLVVSIAAGISQDSLAYWIGAQIPIVRCMPNTPALVQTGATALYANANVTEEQKDLAENILRAVGLTLWLDDEGQMDAVTAVSGSGPAYFFLLMETMEKIAIEMGLSEQVSRLLIQQTALGAAKIALESSDSPSQLREKVTSPGGTTQKAIESFQRNGFEEMVRDALQAAKSRSIEMSKQLGDS